VRPRQVDDRIGPGDDVDCSVHRRPAPHDPHSGRPESFLALQIPLPVVAHPHHPMVALAVKRGADARRYARDKPDDPVPVMAVLMTPVDCWIRVRALVSIGTYRRRWKW
jgi:hypothetical protein